MTGPDYRIAVLSGPTFAREAASGESHGPGHRIRRQESGRANPGRFLRTHLPRVWQLRSRRRGDRRRAEERHRHRSRHQRRPGSGPQRRSGTDHARAGGIDAPGGSGRARMPETMSGLAGLGDLVLTCTGDLSRNRQVGLKLAAGLELGRILDSTPMVAEGVKTTVRSTGTCGAPRC